MNNNVQNSGASNSDNSMPNSNSSGPNTFNPMGQQLNNNPNASNSNGQSQQGGQQSQQGGNQQKMGEMPNLTGRQPKTRPTEDMSQEERANVNNENNIRNAAKVAKNVDHPYVKAAGMIAEGADKLTGGKSSEMLGKGITKANKMTPGGKQIQKGLNKLNESGAGDKIGEVGDKMGGMSGKGGGGPKGAGASKGAAAAGKTNNNPSQQPKQQPAPLKNTGGGGNQSPSPDEEPEPEENPKQENSQEEEKKEKKGLLKTIGAVMALVASVLIPLITMALSIILVLLPIIIIVVIVVVIISTIISFLTGGTDENRCAVMEHCYYITMQDQVTTYTMDEYLAGSFEYYFSDSVSDNPENIKAALSIINRNATIFSSKKDDSGTCTLSTYTEYNQVDIPSQEDIETYNQINSGQAPENSLSDALKNKIERYLNNKILASSVRGELILFSPKPNLNPSALQTPGSDYKTIIKKYYGYADDEEFIIMPICDYLGSTGSGNRPLISGDFCSNVTITSGSYAGTYDIEDYVAGVVAAEVGGFNDIETFKALSVAARTYLLTRSSVSDGMCYIGNSTAQQTFRRTSNANIINAVDQTKGEVVTDASGKLASTEYDAFCYARKDNSNYYLKQQLQPIPVTWAETNVRRYSSASYLVHPCGTRGDGGHGRGMSQMGAFYLSSQSSKDYNYILNYYYSGIIGSIYATGNNGGTVNAEGFIQPLANITRCSSYFGPRANPFTNQGTENHGAIDLPQTQGTPIYAAHSGTVVTNEYNAGGYGNYVMIRGDDGRFYTLYAHMVQRAPVSVGQHVNAGDVIGYVGSTGRSTGPHLHFEVRTGSSRNSRIDPLTVLPGLCG